MALVRSTLAFGTGASAFGVVLSTVGLNLWARAQGMP